MNRMIIVAHIQRDAESAVAQIFADSDATALPYELGVEQRSLYSLGDLYLHVIDFRHDPVESMRRAGELPGFQKISADLRRFIRPYDEENWRSPRDAVAHEFYRWSATNGISPLGGSAWRD